MPMSQPRPTPNWNDSPPAETNPKPPVSGLEKELLDISEIPELAAAIAADDKIQTLRDAAHGELGPGLLAAEPSGSAEWVLRQHQLASFDAGRQTAGVELLASSPAFNIATDRIDALPGVVDDSETRAMLESIQRIQNVATDAQSVPQLLNAKFTSAAQIAALPLGTFIASVPGMAESTAEQIHGNATAVTQRNEMALAAVAPSLRDDAAALAIDVQTPRISQGVNLDSLFANSVATKCDDCCSVLSPAAYLVDLLEFLARGSKSGSDVRARLFDRRPDIGQLELSCANTNTELPYIDLVNEALESYLASKHRSSKAEVRAINNKEGDPSAQLVAEPQNVDLEAYELLQSEVFPVGILPFDRGLEQTRILLEKLGTSRQELLEVFAVDKSRLLTDTVTAEVLKLPSAEYTALCKENLGQEQGPGGPALVRLRDHKYWGFDSQAEMLNDYTGISRVRTQFLPRTGYTFDHLVELLQTKFVNGSVPKVLTKARDGVENSLDRLWAKVHWNKAGQGRAAQWGDLLKYLGIQDIDSEDATEVVEAFPKLPNLCILMAITTEPERMPPFNTPTWDSTRSWPMTGFVDFVRDGQQATPNNNNNNNNSSGPFAVLNEYGHLLSKTTRQPLGYFDADGILRQVNTNAPYYSLPEYSGAGNLVVRYTENGPVIATLLRDDENPSLNGEMTVAPADDARIAASYATRGPREAASVAGWSWQPRPADGEPDPKLLAIRTLSGQPVPAERWRQINDLVRLQKRMGWTITETDQVCTALGADAITASFLEELGLVKTLQALTGTTLNQALVFARDMPEALYRKLFLKPSILANNPDFALGERGTPLFKSHTDKTELQKRSSALAAAFSATPADIARVLAASRMATRPLSLSSLSAVYRHIMLCRSLGLPLNQLSSLVAVYGADPFEDIRTTLGFFTQWQTILDRYPVTPAHWEYFASGEDPSGQFKPAMKDVIQTALAIRKIQVSGGDEPSVLAILSAAFDAIPTDIMSLLYEELSVSNTAPTGSSSWFFIPPATGEYTLQIPKAPNNPVPAPAPAPAPAPTPATAAIIGQGDVSPEDTVSLDTPINLVGGQAYRVRPSNPASLIMTFSSKTAGSQAAPPGPLPADSVLSYTDVQNMERIMTVLSRYALFFSASNLTPGEYEHLLKIGRIPPKDERLGWAQIVTLVKHGQLRDVCQSAVALATLLGNPTFASAASAASAVSAVTGWEPSMIKALLAHFEAVGTSKPVVLSVELLDKLRVAYGIVKKLGLPDPAQLLSWTSPLANLRDAAAGLRVIARAKVDEVTWEGSAAALFDPLRRASRDALVAACLRALPSLQDANSLFEYFLIDVGMGTCLLTSRLKQAISSVQIYVQRCLLGLEADNGVLPSHINAKEWAWMQSYQTWRANRTIILYPENWLEPSLRDSKSEAFKTLEAAMAQGKRTSQELIGTYVASMVDVADLEPVTVCEGPNRDHIIARTRIAPHKFFYRSFDRPTRCWSPWETVQVDIPTIQITRSIQKSPMFWVNLFIKTTTGWDKAELDNYLKDHPSTPLCSGSYLQATVLNDNDDHLILFIPTLSEKSWNIKGGDGNTYTKYFWEVGMAFSERKDGRWTARQQCPETVTTKNVTSPDDREDGSRPWPILEDPNVDDHLVRQGLFFFLPTKDVKGTPALWAYLLAPVVSLPASDFEWQKSGFASRDPKKVYEAIGDRMVPGLKAAFLGEFSFERGQLSVRRTRPGARFDKLREPSAFTHDWFFQGKTETSGTERTRRIFDYADAGSPAPMYSLATVDVTSLEEQPGRFGKESMTDYFVRCRWTKQVIVRTRTTYKDRDLAVPLSNNFVDWLQDLVYSGKYKDVFDHFSVANNVTWPLSSSNYPDSIPAADRTDGTTVLHQGLGIADRAKPNVWYHELRTPIALYNWELCVHLPMLLANNFVAAQQFDEAIEAVKFVFDPTAHNPKDKSAVWRFLPFRETARDKNPLETAAMTEYDQAEINRVPFNPFAVARQRCTAYMRWFAYKYIEVMIAKGDAHFRRFTLESISLAIQCYVEAAHVYGPAPQSIVSVGKRDAQTFRGILESSRTWVLDQQTGGRNALVQMETLFPFRAESKQLSAGQIPRVNIFGSSTASYFCVPANPALTKLKDAIDDRLYKIRHCQDIDGNARKIALWEPPLDPGAVIRAAASGAGLGSVLADAALSGTMPNFRFKYLVDQALAACEDVRRLGASILKLRRRKDMEQLRLLTVEHERAVTERLQDLHRAELDEAEKSMAVIVGNRDAAALKMEYYLRLLGEDVGLVPRDKTSFDELAYGIAKPKSRGGLPMSSWEADSLDYGAAAMALLASAGAMQGFAAILNIQPQPKMEAAPGGTGVSIKWGPKQIANGLKAGAKWVETIVGAIQWYSEASAKMAETEKQTLERKLEANTCGQDITGYNCQILAQEARIRQAQLRIQHNEAVLAQRAEMDAFLRTKYTNAQLYTWVVNSLQQLYYGAYNLALDLAIKAEQAYRFERGLPVGAGTTEIIRGGYWNSSYDGLLAGEQLGQALRRLQQAHASSSNAHDFEITRSISLREVSPLALARLRASGSTDDFDLPEVLWDMDFPGHYCRRIRSVRVSITCSAGPNTSLNAVLSLLKHRYRVDPAVGEGYVEAAGGGDPRFATQDAVATPSVAVCTGQREAGVFHLNPMDERYMPFEGAGVISKWKLELNTLVRSFDYRSIADVVLHVQYTSRREATGALAKAAGQNVLAVLREAADTSLSRGLAMVVDARAEHAAEWTAFGGSGSESLTIPAAVLRANLPFYARAGTVTVRRVMVLAEYKATGADKSMPLTLAVGESSVQFTLVPEAGTDTRSQSKAYTVGADEKAVDDMGVRWEAEGHDGGSEDWVLRVQDGQSVRGLQLLVGYTVDL